MSYSPEVFAKIREIYNERRRSVGESLEARIAQVRGLPGMTEIEERLGSTGVRVMAALKKNDGGKALDGVRRENEALVERRNRILLENGYPADFCDPRFHCVRCGDTGYVQGCRCSCMREELYNAQAAISGLGALLERQSFENFDVRFYENPQEAESLRDFCMDYADRGFREGKNLALMGATGLGKTHLSTAIAKRVMKNGGSVIYESAPNILGDFQYERFGRGYTDVSPVRTDKYFDADLLIIDDLGSEVTGSFTVSTMYTLINTRLNNRMAMLINTNLSPKELTDRYDQRITSRIFGEFRIMTVEGKDIRGQKL